MTRKKATPKPDTASAFATAFDAGVLAIDADGVRASGPAADVVLEWREAWRAIHERVAKEKNRPGRPEWPSWDSMLMARAQLRTEGKSGTQEQVAEQLGCATTTVQTRARKHGGWNKLP